MAGKGVGVLYPHGLAHLLTAEDVLVLLHLCKVNASLLVTAEGLMTQASSSKLLPLR